MTEMANISNFLLSLAAALADAAGITIGTADAQLWVNQALEGTAMAAGQPYSVLNCYGGTAPNDLQPIPEIAVQVMSQGKNAGATLTLAGSIYAALYENDEGEPRPRNSWAIDAKAIGSDGSLARDPTMPYGWNVRLIVPGPPPGRLGMDERGRSLVSFNFEVSFEADDGT